MLDEELSKIPVKFYDEAVGMRDHLLLNIKELCQSNRLG
jgi:hypothetical protein